METYEMIPDETAHGLTQCFPDQTLNCHICIALVTILVTVWNSGNLQTFETQLFTTLADV